MKELLLSKGFILKSFADGNYYVLSIVPTTDEEMLGYIEKLELDSEEYFEEAILQCDENFGNCSLMIDYCIFDMTPEEFKEQVERL